jgi:hypothetical protein
METLNKGWGGAGALFIPAERDNDGQNGREKLTRQDLQDSRGGFKFEVQLLQTIQRVLVPRSGYVSKPRVASTLG